MRRFESKDFGNANHLAKIGKVGRRKEEVGSWKREVQRNKNLLQKK